MLYVTCHIPFAHGCAFSLQWAPQLVVWPKIGHMHLSVKLIIIMFVDHILWIALKGLYKY